MKSFFDSQGLGFKDVMIMPAGGALNLDDISVKTRIAERLYLNIPIISAPKDTVTESAKAIAMARAGGLGVLHCRMPVGKQVEELRAVKRFESKMVASPIVIAAESPLAEAADLMRNFNISGLPVVDGQLKVVGIVTKRDLRFASDDNLMQPVSSRMSHENLITISAGFETAEAERLMFEHRVEKLVILNEDGTCAGLVTVKDIENMKLNPNAMRDQSGRLLVAAAVEGNAAGYERAKALIDAEADIIFVESPNAAHQEVLTTIDKISQLHSGRVKIIAGNVLTADGAEAVIARGIDAVKVNARGRSGVGAPILSAIMDVAGVCGAKSVPVIAEDSFSYPSDVAKAIAAGADAVMVNSYLAGTDEAPGELRFEERNVYKISPQARDKELRRPAYKGSTESVLDFLMQGLRDAMMDSNSADIQALKYSSKFIRV